MDDAAEVLSAYANDMAGRVSLATLRVKNPKWTPDTADIHDEWLVDGVTSDGEWETLMLRAREVSAEKGQKMSNLERDLTRLNVAYDHILGRGDHKWWSNTARRIRDYNYITSMNETGFAQVSDLGNVVGTLGVRASLKAMPVFRRIFGGKASDEFNEELQQVFMNNTGHLHASMRNRIDDFGASESRYGSKLGERVDTALEYGKRATTLISGMRHITGMLQDTAIAGVNNTMIKAAAQGKAPWKTKRMASLGWSEKDWDEIAEQIRKHATDVDAFDGRKAKSMNFDKWDADVRAKYQEGVYRYSRKVVQENDIGNLPALFSNDLARVIFQFRSFAFAAHGKQMLYNVNMRDTEALMSFLYSTMMGAAAHAARLKLRSLGMSADDAEKEWNKNFGDPARIALTAFQRSPSSGIIPDVADRLAILATGGRHQIFNAYNTKQQTGNFVSDLFANPTWTLGDNIVRGVGGLTDGVDKKDLMAIKRLTPFQNAYGWSQFLSHYISEFD
jgi:hypothetical protein